MVAEMNDDLWSVSGDVIAGRLEMVSRGAGFNLGIRNYEVASRRASLAVLDGLDDDVPQPTQTAERGHSQGAHE